MASNTSGTLFAPFTGAGIAADSIQHINATGNVTAWTSLVVIGATPPTANMILTLPTALGNIGETIKLVRVDSTAFTVTLTAQAGETITFLSAGAELNTQHGSLAVEAATTTEIRQVAQVASGSVAVTPLAYFATGLINSAWGGSGLGVAGIPVVASPATATPTAPVPFNDPSFAVSANVGGFTTSATGITVPITGTYSIAYRADVNTAATGAGAQLLVNGALVNFGKFNENPSDVDTDGQLTLQWLGPITAGQAVQVAHIRQDNAGTDVVKTANMVIEQVPVSSVVDPGDVPVTPLHYTAITSQPNQHVDNVNTVVGAGYTVMRFTDADILNIHNPNGIVNTAANSIDITQTGKYEILWTVRTISALDIAIRVNGVIVAGTDGGTTENQAVMAIRDLVPGDRIEFALEAAQTAGTTLIQSPSVTVKQLPTSTVADPGLVPVTPLSAAQFALSATQSTNVAVGDHVKFDTVDYSTGTNISLDTATAYTNADGVASVGRVTLQPGLYELSADIAYNGAANNGYSLAVYNADTTTLVGNIGRGATGTGGIEAVHTTAILNVAAATRFEVRVTSVSGSVTDIRGGSTASGVSKMFVKELPAATVVDPGAVTVNDQAASGYLDVGGVRMMWGQLSNTNDAAQLVTLPAAFASTAYSISLTPDDGWTVGAGEVTPWKWSGKTTTSFNVDRDDDVTGTALVDWIAIGRKP